MATKYILKRGEYLTIQGSATDINGDAVDISSGYTFVATIKKYLTQTDAEAYVHIDSVSNPTRFIVSSSTVKVAILSSAESNAAELNVYYYDAWAVETASGQETPIDCGIIHMTDTPTDTKT